MGHDRRLGQALVPVVIHGIDVSRYQRDLSMDRVRRESPPGAFAIVKAGQNDWEDPAFRALFRDAKSAGLVPGAYHFLEARSSSASPEAQARSFVRIVKAANGGTLTGALLALDVEPFQDSRPKLADVRRWTREFRKLAGNDRWLFLYTRSGVWASYGNPRIRDVMGSRTVLWNANWTLKPGRGWSAGYGGINTTIHQHGPFPGLRPRIVDGNVFRGTAAQLRAYTRPKAVDPAPVPIPEPEPEPEPIPEPEPPELWRWVASSVGAVLREAPGSEPLAVAVHGSRLMVAGPGGSVPPVAGAPSAPFVAVLSLDGTRLTPPLWVNPGDLAELPDS